MLDFVAASLELAGVWLVGAKDRRCFWLLWSCEIVWAIVAIRKGLWGLLVMVCVFAVVNVRNYRLWGKKNG